MPSPKAILREFPKRLRAVRKRRGLDQEDLGRRAGLQPSAISHFETGTRKPSFENLIRLADALEVTIDYLVGRAPKTGVSEQTERLFRNLEQLSSSDLDLLKQIYRVLAHRGGGKKRLR